MTLILSGRCVRRGNVISTLNKLEGSNTKPYSRGNCLYSTPERDVAIHKYVFKVSEEKQGTVKILGSLSLPPGYRSTTSGPFLNACLKKGQISCYKCLH